MNLQNLNVAELSPQEVRETEGGYWKQIFEAACIIANCAVVFDEWYQNSGYIDDDMGIPFCA